MSEPLRNPVSPSNPYTILAGIKQFGLASDGSDIRDLTTSIENLRSERDEALKALLPFALLCESHVDDDDKDSSGIIFPGPKACISVKHLRDAHRIIEACGR